jgi:hypothetical protein
MAERKQSRAERAERRQAQAGDAGLSKAERKQARAGRKRRAAAGGQGRQAAPVADAAPDDGVELRLGRIEQALAAQSELSEQLLEKLDAVLHEARKSARHSKTAVTQPEDDGDGEPQTGF